MGPSSSSADIITIVDKRVQDEISKVEKKFNRLISSAAGAKPSGVESILPPSRKRRADTNPPPPPRKKVLTPA